MKNLIAPVTNKKILTKAYGSIPHLPCSKMTDKHDKLVDEHKVELFTSIDAIMSYFCTAEVTRRHIRVYITEKVDGSNSAVYKDNDGLLHPLMRKGYDVRTYPNNPAYLSLKKFADYVEQNAERFDELLNPGELLNGEWMLKQHSLKYAVDEPFIPFDITRKRIKGTNIEIDYEPYQSFVKRVNAIGMKETECISTYAMKPQDAYLLLGEHGYHGCLDKPEGLVYRLEVDGKFNSYAKFVTNTYVATNKAFQNILDPYLLNDFNSKYFSFDREEFLKEVEILKRGE